MSIECPHCKNQLHLEPTVTMPDEQTMFFSIKHEGEIISAQTVAGLIKNADGLMKAVAKDIGFKAHVFIKSIEQKPQELVIGFLIAKVKQAA